MNHFPSGVNRIVTLIFALKLLVAGAAILLWKFSVKPVRGWIDKIDQGWFDRAPDFDWFSWALLGVLLVGFLIGLYLVAINLRPNRTGDTQMAGSSESMGELSISPGKIADAVADDLEDEPVILSAKARSLDDRGRKLMRFTVVADPSTPISEVTEATDRAATNIDNAVGGSDVQAQFLIHFEEQKQKTPRVV